MLLFYVLTIDKVSIANLTTDLVPTDFVRLLPQDIQDNNISKRKRILLRIFTRFRLFWRGFRILI